MYGRLYTEMKKAHVTQTELGKLLGISTNAVNYKLSGKREFKSSEMNKICEVIKDVPMQELFKKD